MTSTRLTHEHTANLLTRVPLVASDLIVVAVTWAATYKASREASVLGKQPSITKILFRDGASVSIASYDALSHTETRHRQCILYVMALAHTRCETMWLTYTSQNSHSTEHLAFDPQSHLTWDNIHNGPRECSDSVDTRVRFPCLAYSCKH